MNTTRWLAGGVAAGLLIWLLEGVASTLYMPVMQAALERHSLAMEMSAYVYAVSLLACLLFGLALVFFYAASRPRFGPGPGTALRVAVVLWLGGYVPSLMGLHMMDLLPPGLLLTWGATGLVEMLLASLLGGWMYREA